MIMPSSSSPIIVPHAYVTPSTRLTPQMYYTLAGVSAYSPVMSAQPNLIY